MIKLFEQIREHLEKQYLEVNFDASTGLSPEEIVSELEHHRKQYPDEPQIMTKAWLFHLLCTKGRIMVDADDYFADKLEHNDIMLKLRGEISRHREHTIGYEQTFIHQAYDLMNALAENKMPSPNFLDGVKCQEILEAVSKSIKERGWVKI